MICKYSVETWYYIDADERSSIHTIWEGNDWNRALREFKKAQNKGTRVSLVHKCGTDIGDFGSRR